MPVRVERRSVRRENQHHRVGVHGTVVSQPQTFEPFGCRDIHGNPDAGAQRYPVLRTSHYAHVHVSLLAGTG